MSNDLRRAEEAVMEWAEKLVDVYAKPIKHQSDALARAEAHENLGLWVSRLSALRASQEGKPCPNCSGSGVEVLADHDPSCRGDCRKCPIQVQQQCGCCGGNGVAPTPPAEEAGPCGGCGGKCGCHDILSPCPSCAPSTEPKEGA